MSNKYEITFFLFLWRLAISVKKLLKTEKVDYRVEGHAYLKKQSSERNVYYYEGNIAPTVKQRIITIFSQ